MLRAAHAIVLAAICLLTLGVVMVTSAGATVADPAPLTLERIATSRHAIYAGVAVAALFCAWAAPMRRLARAFVPEGGQREGWLTLILGGLFLLSIALLAYLPGLAHEVNGSRRWVALPGLKGLSFQPSEVVKWGLVALLAASLARAGSRIGSFTLGLAPLLVASGLIILAVAREDLGTGVLLACVTALMLLAGGARPAHLAMLAPPATAGLGLLVWIEPYRLQRIRVFFDAPFNDPQASGYHLVQSLVTIAGGEGLGRGLGHGIQKFGYLPEDQTDFLFAVIAEELGLGGVALVVSLYLAILWSILAIARAEPRPALKLFAIGVGATLGIQAAINLLVVTGWAPTKGIPLPLLSAGGTGWILTAASLGLVAAIGRSQPAEALAALQATGPNDAEDWEEQHDWEEEPDEQDLVLAP